MTSPTSSVTSPKNPGSGLARNVASNWVMFVFSAVVSFFLSPFIVHSLGDVEYGVWTLLGSLLGYLTLLDFGIRGAVTRYVARFMAAGEVESAREFASVALRLFLGVGALALSASLGLALLVHRVFDLPSALQGEARLVLVVSGAAVATTLVAGVYGGIVVGLERFDALNLWNMAIELLRVGAVLATLSQGAGIVVLAGIQLGVALLKLLAQDRLAKSLAPAVRPNLHHWSWRDARILCAFSAASTLMQVAGLLAFYTDSIVIGAFLPVALVTYFSIGSGLTLYARSVVSGLSQVMTPRASALDGQGARGELRTTFLAVSRIATLVTVPIGITFLARGETFIGLWMGAEYAGPAGEVLRVLTVALLFHAGRQVAAATLIGLHLHWPLAAAYIVEGAVNLGLSVLLVRPLGLVGVALGTMIPSLAISLGFIPWFLWRRVHVSPRALARDVWVRPFAAAVPFTLVTLLIEHAWRTPGLPVFFLQVAVALPAAGVGALAVGVARHERDWLVATARAKIGWLTGTAAG